MEGFGEKKENLFSEEQREKVDELLNIIKPIFDSFLAPDADSDQSFEILSQIDEFAVKIKQQGLNPKDYFLWNLLSPDGLSTEFNSPYFDTEDKQIERFIRSLKVDIKEREAAA